MTSTDDEGPNETEDTTLRVPEMAAQEAQDADLAIPGLLLARLCPFYAAYARASSTRFHM
jgi:hypothetical protein